jgi:hypothetical protein
MEYNRDYILEKMELCNGNNKILCESEYEELLKTHRRTNGTKKFSITVALFLSNANTGWNRFIPKEYRQLHQQFPK